MKRPKEPYPGECCGSGCTRCVWDVYYDKLSSYEMMKVDGKLESDEDDESLSSEDSDEEPSNFIGSIVIKYLTEPQKDILSPDCIMKAYIKAKTVSLITSSTSNIINNNNNNNNNNSSGNNPVSVIRIEPEELIPNPLPGDVVEIFVPNEPFCGMDCVGDICTRLGVSPDSYCVLQRSPFVPEGHFPPWLPMNQPITVRNLLTYYVDISSCSYLLHLTFFQSLLRVYNNSKQFSVGGDMTSSNPQLHESIMGTPELLSECASPEKGPRIFKTLMNSGKPMCFPSLIDVLDLFPFIDLPLERMLEISGPLQPRKFSVSSYDEVNSSQSHAIQLCLRQVSRVRHGTLASMPNVDESAHRLATLLNQVAVKRARRLGHSELFRGHVSSPLCHLAAPQSFGLKGVHHGGANIFISTSLFGKSLFAQEFRKALHAAVHAGGGPPLLLIGAGTGIAPLIAGIRELVQARDTMTMTNCQKTAPYPCHVLYGAQKKCELVFHDTIQAALEKGALSSYQWALSRECGGSSCEEKKYVTDLMPSEVSPTFFEKGGRLFACGPTAALKSIRSMLETRLLSEADDDESIQQQRVLLLEEKRQLVFDVWSTLGSFE